MKFKKSMLSKSLCLILILSIFLTPIINVTTYASENQKYIVCPTVTADLGILGSNELKSDKNGDYSGELTPLSSTGLTSVTCVLCGGTGGIPNLYQIYIKSNYFLKYKDAVLLTAQHLYHIFIILMHSHSSP